MTTTDVGASVPTHPLKRQTCHQCHRTVGTLPGGETRPYTTNRREVRPGDFRSWHLCAAGTGCEANPSLKLAGYRQGEEVAS